MLSLRVALAQINPTVGDLDGNRDRIIQYLEMAREAGADLVAFPELAVHGYPPEDLLLKPQFIRGNLAALRPIAARARGITAVVGFVDVDDDIYNAAALIHDGEIVHVYRKAYLPNYGVFDEERYFQRGSEQPVYLVRGVKVGVSICEDIWYPTGPAAVQAQAGAQILININASPYHYGKRELRERMLATRATDNEVIVCYLNTVGGQDELVFDGDSLIYDQSGRLLARGPQFREELVVADLDAGAVFGSRLHDPRRREEPIFPILADAPTPLVTLSEAPATDNPRPPLPAPSGAPRLEGPAEVYAALVTGTRDYIHKNRFQKVLIGLSGGIDSSIVAAIAADALGPENVIGVSMPSRYSSPGSKDDALELAQALGIECLTIPIELAFKAYLGMLEEPFRGTQTGIAEENLQARTRGNILMALSNKFGHMVLTTGNKSEMSVGYATLYGDMAGGFAVIKDVPKTLVYAISEYRNTVSPVIPRAVLEKEPSAELRPDQRDVDSLLPYDVLDPILKAYVEEDRSIEEIEAMGYAPETVERVIRLVDRSEYKRRQAPPGIKVTARAFGRDRRLPITNGFVERG